MDQEIQGRLPAAAPGMRRRALGLALALAATLLGTGCGWGSRSSSDAPAGSEDALHRAHDAYVAAINKNAIDQWVASLADDVVFLVPNQAAIVGKEAVGAWASRYLQEVTTQWTKPVEEWQISGPWAFGRYVYTVSDSAIVRDPSTEGGGTANDSGWGLIVYRRADDGRWLVAREAWGSDRPAR